MDSTGRQWFRGALSGDALAALDGAVASDGAPGVRLSTDRLGRAVCELQDIAAQIAPKARAVRVVGFDKSDGLNWTLGWHQDRVVAVSERADLPGFSAWTRKAGVWHAEPPAAFLQTMFFLRVHLDGADAENGALEIAHGSHLFGRVLGADARRTAEGCNRELCVASRGDILAASALLLHRSAASRSAAPRRAIRIDYATIDLPSPLMWAAEKIAA